MRNTTGEELVLLRYKEFLQMNIQETYMGKSQEKK